MTACQDHDVAFSVTVKTGITAIRRAIDAIDEDAWVPIPYWFEGGADVAETTYAAFKNTKDEVTLRLIVRRVRPTPGSQLALDVVFDYHAIRDLKAGGLAHVPSGIFTANAAWLALAVLAHHLGRWTLAAAGHRWSTATTETLRTKLVSMPARLVHSARRLRLRAPTNWPWRDAFETALVRIAAIPAPT